MSEAGFVQTYFILNKDKHNSSINLYPILLPKVLWQRASDKVTGSRRHSPAHRRLIWSLITDWSRSNVWQQSEQPSLGQHCSLLQHGEWAMCPKHCLLYFTMAGLLQSAETSLNAVETKKYPWTLLRGTSACLLTRMTQIDLKDIFFLSLLNLPGTKSTLPPSVWLRWQARMCWLRKTQAILFCRADVHPIINTKIEWAIPSRLHL